MPIKHGLTLGKYAPLHKGHQYVIETALDEVDKLTVIAYDCPSVTNIPLMVRTNWIKTLYPEVQVIEARNAPLEVGYTAEIKQMHEDYIINTLGISGVTHFYSSELYGDHMSKALGAIDRRIDMGRGYFPVSAKMIRNNPYKYRHMVDDWVYYDLITRVLFMGAPSTGKTTLCQALAKEYATEWVPEYGRWYWEKYQIDRKLTPEQLLEIAQGQEESEYYSSLMANKYLFCDTSAITTYMFALDYGQQPLPQLKQAADEASKVYDLVFICDTDIPYDDTPERDGAEHRIKFQAQILDDLRIRKIPFFMLRGTLEQRVKQVKNVLNKFEKYMNIVDLVGEMSC